MHTILDNKLVKISIELHKSPRNNYVFTSFDSLRGRVVVEPVKDLHVSSAKLSFQGFSKTALDAEMDEMPGTGSRKKSSITSSIASGVSTPTHLAAATDASRETAELPLQNAGHFLEPNLNIECHKLVDLEQHLSGATVLSAGVCYSFEFRFLVPSESRCCVDADHCADSVFKIHPLTHQKFYTQHTKNFHRDREVLQYTLPPSLGGAGGSCDGVRNFSVQYFLKLEFQAKKKLQAFYPVQFMPRETSTEANARDLRSLRTISCKSSKLFQLDERDGAELNKKKWRSVKKFSLFTKETLYLDLRLYDSDYLTPNTCPQFKIFLVSMKHPSEIKSLSEEHQITKLSLKNMDISLLESTKVKNQAMHTNTKFVSDCYTRKINLFKSDQNLNYDIWLHTVQKIVDKSEWQCRFDTDDGVPLFELEIPVHEFSNMSPNAPFPRENGICIPSDVSPSFRCCNVKRSYRFLVQANFNVYNEESDKTKKKKKFLGMHKDTTYTSLYAHVKVLSGINGVIESSLINRDLAYTVEDVHDMALVPEELPKYEEVY